jgi:hypothetical protein
MPLCVIRGSRPLQHPGAGEPGNDLRSPDVAAGIWHGFVHCPADAADGLLVVVPLHPADQLDRVFRVVLEWMERVLNAEFCCPAGRVVSDAELVAGFLPMPRLSMKMKRISIRPSVLAKTNNTL